MKEEMGRNGRKAKLSGVIWLLPVAFVNPDQQQRRVVCPWGAVTPSSVAGCRVHPPGSAEAICTVLLISQVLLVK